MKFFSLENPIWKFIGNLADFFLLSCLWYLCCLPVVTAGAATTALYYVTFKDGPRAGRPAHSRVFPFF